MSEPVLEWVTRGPILSGFDPLERSYTVARIQRLVDGGFQLSTDFEDALLDFTLLEAAQAEASRQYGRWLRMVALRRLYDMGELDKWTRVSATDLPDDEVTVLAYNCHRKDSCAPFLAYLYGPAWYDDRLSSVVTVTHWRHLPAPPTD